MELPCWLCELKDFVVIAFVSVVLMYGLNAVLQEHVFPYMDNAEAIMVDGKIDQKHLLRRL